MGAAHDIGGGFEFLARWGARVLSVLAVGLVATIAAGEGVPNPFSQPPGVMIGLMCLLGIVLGLVAAWRFETVGATVATLCFAAFEVNQIARGGRPAFGLMFVLLGLPGILFLIAAVCSASRRPADALSTHPR